MNGPVPCPETRFGAAASGTNPAPKGLVVVVEDQAEIRSVLLRTLEAAGHRALGFDTGESLLAHLADGGPADLVLLDVGLPGIGGFEVCHRLKSSPLTRLIPVIILTGLDASAHRIEGLEVGADDFISKPFDRLELLARVRSLIRLKSYTDELEDATTVLMALARTIEARDPYTHGHCERLSALSVTLARHRGLGEAEQVALRHAGILHDIGKIIVPDAILLKPGPLTPEERRIVERHPVTGEEICRPIRSLGSVRPIIRHHHERLDGSGYPDGLSGAEIPMTARVMQVVDVFDALTTTRPYRTAMPTREALEILAREARRGWWDPELVEAMLELAATGALRACLEAAAA